MCQYFTYEIVIRYKIQGVIKFNRCQHNQTPAQSNRMAGGVEY
jgi:hypothetical protein